MSRFKKCLAGILAIVVMVMCCACGASSSLKGLYRCTNANKAYLLFNDEDKCVIYGYTYSTPNTFYTYDYFEVESSGNNVKLTYPGYEDWAETFTVEKTAEGFKLTSTSSDTVLELESVDMEDVTFDSTMTYMTLNNSEDTTDNVDVNDTAKTTDETPALEMNTHYAIYTGKYPVKDAYVNVDNATQDIANEVELAYEDFLIDVVFKNDNIDWTEDIDYTWHLDICDTGVYIINISMTVPDADYGYMKHEISSVITFDEYGYWEVSNFDMQSCPVN